MKRSTLLATLTMVGTIIGAGIFGVPFVFAQAGIPIGIVYMVILGASAIVSCYFYVHVIAATPGKHRLVGYTERYLGKRAARVLGVTTTLELLGAILAYIILGGSFLTTLLGGSEVGWGIIFLGVIAMLLLLPFKKTEVVEAALTWVLLGVALIIIIAAGIHVRPEFLVTANAKNWFLPYGVIFFSLGGASAIPDVVDSLRKNIKSSVTATTIGTLVAIVITGLFGLVVAGASGAGTSQNAILGLVPVVGKSVVVIGAVFGFLAVATSFIATGSNLKEQFQYDLKFPPWLAWAVTLGVPLLAYLAGARSFVSVIGFLGSVFGVLSGITIALIARKMPRVRLRPLVWPIIILFLLGIVSEIITLIK